VDCYFVNLFSGNLSTINEKLYNVKKKYIEGFYQKLYQYWPVFKWMIFDSVWRFKGVATLILVAGFLGVTFQVAAIGQVIRYAKVLESGEIVRFLGYEFEPRTSWGLLLMLGGGILFSLLISAWLIYYSRTNTLKLCRRYEEFCTKRILVICGSELKFWMEPEGTYGDERDFLKLSRTDARYCGLALRMILNAIIPAITFVVAFAALLYINLLLTLLIMVLVLISSGFLYKVNIVGARSTSMMEENSGKTAQEYNRIIQQQKGISAPIQDSEAIFRNLFSSKTVKQYLNAFEGRFKAIENSQFVSNILIAVSTFVIFVILGSRIIFEGEGWGRLIVYLVALRYGLTNLKQCSRSITSTNRSYYQVRRYFYFLNNAENISKVKGTLPSKYTIKVGPEPLKGSLESWDISQGGRIGLMSLVKLNRYTLAGLTEGLLGHSSKAANDALSSMCFVTSRYEMLLGRSLRTSLGLPLDLDWEEFCKEMEVIGLQGRIKELFNSLDEPVTPEEWVGIGLNIKFALAMFAALKSDCQWIILEEEGLKSFSDTARKYLLSCLSGRITVIVYNGDMQDVGMYNEDVVSLIDGTNSIAMGSPLWIKENWTKLEDVLKNLVNRKIGKKSSEEDSSVLELDDI
jgi:hypothetical protein